MKKFTYKEHMFIESELERRKKQNYMHIYLLFSLDG